MGTTQKTKRTVSKVEANSSHPEPFTASGSPPIQPSIAGNAPANIDPRFLADVDLGLFHALRRLGTSKERICSAMFLSYAEYDYIIQSGSV